MSDTPPQRIWLNALSCVNPTAEFLQGVGRTVLDHLAAAPPPEPDEHGLKPWRRVTIEVRSS